MWSRIVDHGTSGSDDRFHVDFIGERSMEVATAAHVSNRAVFLPLRGLSLTLPRANTRFFPIQQCRSSWWSLIEPFPERSHHLGWTWFVPCAVSHAPTHLPPGAPQ